MALLPDRLFLWTPKSGSNPDKAPEYVVEGGEILSKYLDNIPAKQFASAYDYENVVTSWLQEIAGSEPSDSASLKWIYESGLYDAVKDGSVVMETLLPV